MRFRNLGMSALLVAALAGLGFGADTYTVDPDHSMVGFSVRHMVITNVRGNFKDYSGTIVYDDKDITKSSVDVTIKTASIDTDNDKRDEHLRNSDFFDAEKHPTITFKSKKIEKKGKDYIMHGTLTMRDVSKEVQLPFAITGTVKDPWGNTRLGAEAGTTIDRQDYGVSWNKVLDNGGLAVGNDVKIELAIEAIKKQSQ